MSSPESMDGADERASFHVPKVTGAHPRLMQATLVLISSYLVIRFLSIAKNLLIPLVLAFFFWFLITSLRQALAKIKIAGRQMPRPLAFVLALALISLAAVGLANLITNNVAQVIQASDSYEQNLKNRLGEVTAGMGFDGFELLSNHLQNLDLAEIIENSARALTSLLGDTGLIGVYLIFLFVEEKPFDRKLDLIFKTPQRREEVRALLGKIASETRAYIGLKTLVSLMTAVPSFGVMAWIGLDYAPFWAILIFVFNFVPNFGSLVATILPSIIALLQFEGWRPFLIVAVGILAIQLGVANLIEPRIMARSLNLSPLVIILSLVVWGTLWGIAGMFLCVPLMVLLMIVLSHFPSTRPVAILLSQDGQIRTLETAATG